MKKREPDSHKGENGRVLIVGGCEEYVGAVTLAGLAAFTCGADIVSIAAPEKVAWAVNCHNPNFITYKMTGRFLRASHFERIKELCNRHDVLLIGNGVGLRDETKSLMKKCFEINISKVVDADAIKVADIHELDGSIITPHQKEYEILLENSGVSARDVQTILNSNVILLKGRVDKIISKERICENETGNPGMTVGGTGDVLAGLCAGFVSLGYSLFESARIAAYLNGLAGDFIYEKKGNALTALDLVDILPNIIKEQSF